jgi:hypothetical protein
MSLIKNIVTRVMRGQLSKLDGLYKRHSGEECYIFGNGISLKWMDMHQFADRPSILATFMIYHKEVNALKIPYCSIIEPYFFYPIVPYPAPGGFRFIKNLHYREYRKSILQNPDTLFFVNFSNYPVARVPNALYVSRFYKPPFATDNPFSENPQSYDGTLKFQISLAIYLGFKKAYLLGHDYTHSPSRNLHFYEKGKGVITEHKDFCLEFLNYAREKIDLVTVTLDGSSTTMKAMTYKELTSKVPHFRENTEIVDMVKLEDLAAWEGCSIF